MVVAVALVSCASTQPPEGSSDTNASTSDKVLQFFGLKRPTTDAESGGSELPMPGRRIKLEMLSSDALNLNAVGQPVALLTRIYLLKGPDAFLKAPYETFGDPAKEKELLGDDLLESRDVQLVPGQRYQSTDVIKRDIGFIGVVALYRNPDPMHWRYAFKTDRAELSGISLALHACAMTVTHGRPVHASPKRDASASFPCPSDPLSIQARSSEIQP